MEVVFRYDRPEGSRVLVLPLPWLDDLPPEESARLLVLWLQDAWRGWLSTPTVKEPL